MSAQYNVTRVRVVPFRSQQDSRLAEKVDYPAFKGPSAPAATANGASVSALFPVHAYFAISTCFNTLSLPQVSVSSFIHLSFCFYPRWAIKLWLKVLKCITTSIKSNRCSQWKSKIFVFFLYESPLKRHTFTTSSWYFYLVALSWACFCVSSNKPEQKVVDSEVTSDEEDVGGGFTVYECPGLAPVGFRAHTWTTWIISGTRILLNWLSFLLFYFFFIADRWDGGQKPSVWWLNSRLSGESQVNAERRSKHTFTPMFLGKKGSNFTLPAWKLRMTLLNDCFLVRLLTYFSPTTDF